MGGLFGLALARAILDTWPLLIGSLPRGPLALGTALALALLGLGLSFRRPLPLAALIPLLLPTLTLRNPTPHPFRDWVLILGGLGGLTVVLTTIKGYRPA